MNNVECPFDLPRRTRLRNRRGRCYELSGHAALFHPSAAEWRLVHGEVDMVDGRRMGHAWVRRGDWIYDSVLDLAFPLSKFMTQFRAVEFASWAGGLEVSDMLTQFGHWGPWLDMASGD